MNSSLKLEISYLFLIIKNNNHHKITSLYQLHIHMYIHTFITIFCYLSHESVLMKVFQLLDLLEEFLNQSQSLQNSFNKVRATLC